MKPIGISHWSFKNQIRLTTVFAVLGLIIAISFTFFTIDHYESSVTHVTDVEIAQLYHITEAYEELSNIHFETFNLIKNAPKKDTEQIVYLRGRNLLDRIDSLLVKLSDNIQIPEHSNTEKAQENIEFGRVHKELLSYRRSISLAIEMISVNMNLSEKYLLEASNSFNQTNRYLANVMFEITSLINSEMHTELNTIKQVYWPTGSVILGLVALMLLSSFLVTRIIRKNFLFVRESLDNLHNGNTDIRLPKINGNNEIAHITDSLEKFRTSLIELDKSQSLLRESNRQLRDEAERRLIASKDLQNTLRELSRAIDAAEASSQAKSLFLANMSHELRTPLNAVIGMAEILKMSSLDEEDKDYVEAIFTQGNHLLKLLNDVLDYSRNESGQFTLEYHAFGIRQLVEEVASAYPGTIKDKNIVFSAHINKDIPEELHGDPLRIRQVLINLVSNAYKFTTQGKISIDVKLVPMDDCAQNPPKTCRNKDMYRMCDWTTLRFAVSDTGIGIEKDKLDYIFRNFTQVDESFTREHGGIGLGLAISKQLVELMGGQIGVESTPGQGSTFWFTLCFPTSLHIEGDVL